MRFRLLGFPVHVDPTFFLIVVLLGAQRNNATLIAIWVAVVFVSIIAHELGHAVAGRWFGLTPSIRLYGMGGLTSWSGPPLSPGRHITVSLAGPVAGFVIGGLVLAADRSLPSSGSFYVMVAVGDLLWVNFGWGLLNLLPIFPLDGGQILRSFVHLVRGRPDDRIPLTVSTVVATAAALLALISGWLWAGLLAVFFAIDNGRRLATLIRATPS